MRSQCAGLFATRNGLSQQKCVVEDKDMAFVLRTTKGSRLTHAELDANFSQLAASSGSSLVGFLQSGAGAVARTVQAKERDIVSVTDFGQNGVRVSLTQTLEQ